MERDLQRRLFQFAIDVIFSIRELPNTVEYKVINFQLVKSSTSSGANYEESQAAISKADFSYKIGLSLKEMRESNYWIRIINATVANPKKFNLLELESEELKKILGSIYVKSSKRR
jgi:four helix bundle protein